MVVGDFNVDFIYFCSHRDDLAGVNFLFHHFLLDAVLYCLLHLPNSGKRGLSTILSNDSEFICDVVPYDFASSDHSSILFSLVAKLKRIEDPSVPSNGRFC